MTSNKEIIRNLLEELSSSIERLRANYELQFEDKAVCRDEQLIERTSNIEHCFLVLARLCGYAPADGLDFLDAERLRAKTRAGIIESEEKKFLHGRGETARNNFYLYFRRFAGAQGYRFTEQGLSEFENRNNKRNSLALAG